jgi:serine/threonine-protein phosphatase 6 regulatory ankyrin repeat subunit B
MHLAAEKGKTVRLRQLLKAGNDINATDGKGSTPLFLACYNGHVEAVDFLIESKAKIELSGSNPRTPIMAAAQEGHLEVVKSLIAAKAQLNKLNREYLLPLHSACSRQSGHAIVAAMLAAGAKPNVKGSHSSPLRVALRFSAVESAKLLIEAKADVVESEADMSPLSFTAFNHLPEMAKLLIDSKAPVEGRESRRGPVVELAVTQGEPDVLELLLANGADITKGTSDDKTTLLHMSTFDPSELETLTHGLKNVDIDDPETKGKFGSSTDYLRVMEQLLLHKADVNARGEPDNITPLMSASVSRSAHGAAAVAMLVKYGANINAVDATGKTALVYACQMSSTIVVDALLKAKADPSACDKDTICPLMVAVQENNVGICKKLLESAADVNYTVKEHTVLDFAELCNQNTNPQIINLLKKHGGEMWPDLIQKKSPLLQAAMRGNIFMVNGLLGSASAEEKEYLLVLASGNGVLPLVKLLLSAGVPAACYRGGATPLAIAASNNRLEIVKMLLDAKADITKVCGDGMTALQGAAAKKHKEVVVAILTHANELKKNSKK